MTQVKKPSTPPGRVWWMRFKLEVRKCLKEGKDLAAVMHQAKGVANDNAR